MANLHEIKPIAAALLREYSLTQNGWVIAYDLQSKRVFGSCNSQAKLIRLNPLLCVTRARLTFVQNIERKVQLKAATLGISYLGDDLGF